MFWAHFTRLLWMRSLLAPLNRPKVCRAFSRGIGIDSLLPFPLQENECGVTVPCLALRGSLFCDPLVDATDGLFPSGFGAAQSKADDKRNKELDRHDECEFLRMVT